MVNMSISPVLFSSFPLSLHPKLYFPIPLYMVEKLFGNGIVEEGFKEMTQSVKCLLGKCEDLSLAPSTHIRELCGYSHMCL